METFVSATSEELKSESLKTLAQRRRDWPPSDAARPTRSAVSFYVADASGATPLRGLKATGAIRPPPAITKPKPRAANQYRTPIAPMIPIVAPATTSLG